LAALPRPPSSILREGRQRKVRGEMNWEKKKRWSEKGRIGSG